MIYANISDKNSIKILDEDLKKCFSYIEKNDMLNMEIGNYEIQGTDIFVNIVSYDTVDKSERFWEAHKKYLDIHFMLAGSEKINLNFINNLEIGDYDEEKDFLALKGDENANVIMQKGDYLICYPNDAHMTAVKVNASQKIKKAIFKILIK